MQISKKLKFYTHVRNELKRNADTINFLFLQELGTGKYVLPELCSALGLARSNFNASLIRLKKKNFICYSGHSSNGILLWWIKKNIDDIPSYKSDAPRWIIENKNTKHGNTSIKLGTKHFCIVWQHDDKDPFQSD